MRPVAAASRSRAPHPARARGFSLLELMVALVLGLIVTGAVIATFISVHTASKDTTGIAELADDGRIAINILQQTLRSAGYMACNSTLRQSIAGGPNQTHLLAGDFTEALSGYEATGTGPTSSIQLVENPPGDNNQSDWATTSELGGVLATSVAGNPTAMPIQESDLIAVHTTNPTVMPTYTTGPSSASSVSVQSTAGFVPGAVGIVSNCANSVVDTISGVSGGTISFAQSLGQQFGAGSQVGIADTIVFYIGKGKDGDGALYSYSLGDNSTFVNAPAEIAPDIENMQILYGVDTIGSTSATEYVTASQLANAVANNPNCPPIAGTGGVEFNCVVSVKIALLAASPLGAVPLPKQAATFNLLGTTVTAPLDTRLRKVFETTVSLRDTTT